MRVEDLFGEGESSVHAQNVSDFLKTFQKLRIGWCSGLNVLGRGIWSIMGGGKVSSLGEVGW
jgi:hypothetical protein